MGYKLSVSINTYKAVDYADLGSVNLIVYHEGESFSIMTLTSNSDGWAYGTLDRSHWQEVDTKRVKVYFEKDGFLKGCVKLNYEGSFIDPQDVKNHSYSGDLLLVESEVEVLPPPNQEPL